MVILSIQFAVWGLIALDAINIHIPLLRQLICFIYLTFVPGIIIIRILKLHDLGNIKSVLYSAGLSLATLMFVGLFINTVYPIFGILKPLSSIPLILTISLVILFLLLLSYLRDNEYVESNIKEFDNNYSIIPLILCLIPFLSIFGTYLMNLNGNNIIQMILLLIIGLMPLIILKWIPERFYSFGIFIISLSLLLHTSLISSYIWGADINTEYIFSNLVLVNSIWNSTIYNDINAMLSIVFLAPTYSTFMNLNLVWIYKIVYPTLFSLVPLGLFIIFKRETNNKIAFLACFFFMSTSVFFNVMPTLARQEIAELFIVLLIILVLDKQMNKIPRSILSLIFGASLIVSHYGTAYIFLFILILAFLISYIKIPKISKFQHHKNNLIVGSFLLFFIVLASAWYMYVSSSSIFDVGVNLGSNILSSFTDIMNPQTSQGLYIIQYNFPIFQSIERYLNIIAQFFIGVGILSLIFSKNRFNNKINSEYKLLSISSFIIVAAGIVVPFFASALNSDRLYTITLIILAPFFVIGFLKFFEILNSKVNVILKKKKLIDFNKFLPLVSVFLVIFFLFSSAFIYQIFDAQKQGSFSINSNTEFYNLKDSEISSINWMKNKSNPNLSIYTSLYDEGAIFSITNKNNIQISRYNLGNAQMNYIFLGRFNVKNNQIYVRETSNDLGYIPISNLEDNMSKIYDDGESTILIGR